jgi:hypothetical protein
LFRWATMSTKLIVFSAALIAAGPVLAAVGISSGSSSSAGSSSASSAHSGSGSGGGGHVGASGGGGGRSAASSLGGRGAALASHGNVANHGIHANALHATNSIAGKLSAEQSTSKMGGMDHHHHPFRHEPRYREHPYPEYSGPCVQEPEDPFRPWLCSGATKSFTGTRRQS